MGMGSIVLKVIAFVQMKVLVLLEATPPNLLPMKKSGQALKGEELV